MKKILELIKIINRNKTKAISIVGHGNTTKIDRFYHLLTAGKVTTDKEAFEQLYNSQKNKNSYYKLKHELKERLYNTAFFIDAKQVRFSNRRQAYIECQSLLCLANILNAIRARDNFVDVCNKVIAISKKFEFTAELLTATTKLTNSHLIRGKYKEAKETMAITESLIELYRKESYATIYWSQIKNQYVRNRSLKSKIAEEAKEYIDRLDLIKSDRSSQTLDYITAALSMTVHMATGNYKKATTVLEPALEELTKYRFVESTFFFSLAINLIACCVPLKRYQQGERTVQLIYPILEVETINWFKTREMHFILLIHTKRYRQASELHKDTVNRKKLKKLPGYLQEIWIIYGAYLRILANAGHITISATEKANTFRINRYLNSLPTFSKDKRGQNIPVLISQIVLLLQQKKLDQIDDRFEALGKYRSRYAGIEKNFRGNVFLHMLQQVTKNSFERKKIEKKTAHLYHLFSAVPIDITSQGYDQEILPYEDLWELLLEAL